MDSALEEYYGDPEQEWNRLAMDAYHSLEFLVTMHHMREHLPPSGRVLDAGGGPGRYSIELCRAGYDVTLLDPCAGLISAAREKLKSEPEAVRRRLVEAVVGDIRDLSRFEPDQFDAVLCLGGPLTHISEETERSTAMSELVRVAKPGAVVCISVMGYLAMIRAVLTEAIDELLDPSYQEMMSRGDNRVGGMVWHFFRADELRRLAESSGLTTLVMAGCEGISSGMREATNLLAREEAKWQRWVHLVLASSTEPEVVDMAEHILYIGLA